MAMALAARGDFLATSAAGAVATALTGTDLAEGVADLPGEVLVALVTDGVAVFAGKGFLAEGGVLTGVWDTLPCREAVEDVVTAFLTGTTFLPAGELAGLDLSLTAAGVGFFATGFLTGTAFLAGMAFLAAGALALVFDLALALALCWVDFTAHLLSAGPGESIETPRLLLFFYIFAILFMPAGVFTCRPLARGLYSA